MALRFWFLFASFCWAYLQAQAQASTKATIAGTVVNSTNGSPISGALVILLAQPTFGPGEAEQNTQLQPPAPQRAVTDASGKFSFQAKNSVSAALQVSRQGYRAENDGNRDMALIFVEPADFANATIRLAPQSVVTGRVVDSDGEPLYGLTVEAVRINIVDGRRQLVDNYANNVTDDRGEYRLWNLPPGAYYIKVAGRMGNYNNAVASMSFELSQEAYGATYYPSASTQESAQVVKVEPGQTVKANLTLETHKAYQILGKVSGLPSGRPVQLRLVRGVDILGNRYNVNVAAGTFQVGDVTPGSYLLQIYTASGSPAWMAEVPVNVGEGDVTGVSAAMVTGVDVRAKFEFSGEVDGLPLLRARRIDSLAPPGAPSETMAMTTETDSFFKGLLPGNYEISFGTSFGDHYVSSILAGTTDVLEEGLSVAAGSAPELTVRLAQGAGTLQGTIENGTETIQQSRSDGRWTLLLVGKRGLNPTYRSEMAFDDQFEIAGVQPGTYSLYAWPSQHPLEFRNAAVLDRLSRYATSLKVGNGETIEVKVKPIPKDVLP